jgi:prepilin peptidase dependent protein B
MRRAPSASIASQRGLGLVELLLGAAIGLFIVGAALTLLAGQLRENRGLLLEARLMQDLRSAADLIGRDLRRAGHWGAAADGVWSDGASSVAANPYSAVTPLAAASDAASFRYSRDVVENHRVDSNEQFGHRLRAGVIEIELGAGNWQALTDAGTLKVTEFSVTPTSQSLDLGRFCANPCAAGSATCPPTQQVRSVALVLTAQLVADPAVSRSLRSEVRLRNDAVTGACSA